MVEIGKKVPNLGGTTNGGKAISLSGLKGKSVVVYFYPKDNTTGCTLEAQGFRDAAAKFAKCNAVVIGVSRDSVKSHDGFIAKHGLPFDLVADTDESWCRAFDVIQEKVLYGRRYLGVVRSTFLIGPDGRLQREWRNVKVPGHVEAVLAALDPAGGKNATGTGAPAGKPGRASTGSAKPARAAARRK